jgi:nucleoside-diphosphate-sugar epimerase
MFLFNNNFNKTNQFNNIDYNNNINMISTGGESNKIKNEIFNIGYENMSIKEIALKVKKAVEEKFPEKNEIRIETFKSEDGRSYHINSDKIKNILNFKPKYNVEYAVYELCDYFKNGTIKDSFKNDIFYNVRTLKNINAK